MTGPPTRRGPAASNDRAEFVEVTTSDPLTVDARTANRGARRRRLARAAAELIRCGPAVEVLIWHLLAPAVAGEGTDLGRRASRYGDEDTGGAS